MSGSRTQLSDSDEVKSGLREVGAGIAQSVKRCPADEAVLVLYHMVSVVDITSAKQADR
jgi:hypothetical protein